jgi:hypothetical protein
MDYFEVSHKDGWTKGTNSYAWSPGLKYHMLKKGNTIADCLENQFTLHDLCDENKTRWVVAKVQALHETADDTLLEIISPCVYRN